ncbi:MAG: hypothetical protein ABWY45_13380 [Mycobacterium sp.]
MTDGPFVDWIVARVNHRLPELLRFADPAANCTSPERRESLRQERAWTG